MRRTGLQATRPALHQQSLLFVFACQTCSLFFSFLTVLPPVHCNVREGEGTTFFKREKARKSIFIGPEIILYAADLAGSDIFCAFRIETLENLVTPAIKFWQPSRHLPLSREKFSALFETRADLKCLIRILRNPTFQSSNMLFVHPYHSHDPDARNQYQRPQILCKMPVCNPA